MTFTIDLTPPTVTLEALPERSNVNKPTFKGTASEPGPVTVHVFKGSEAKGEEAESGEADDGLASELKSRWPVEDGEFRLLRE